MQRGKIRNFPEYTHFACLPFIHQPYREAIKGLQMAIRSIADKEYPHQLFEESNHLLSHITISMLVLHREDTRQQIAAILLKLEPQVKAILEETVITFTRVRYFSRMNQKTKKNEVTLLYLEINKDEHFRKVEKVTDLFIRQMLQSEIITPAQLKQMRIQYDHAASQYKSEQSHLTLFRVNNVPLDGKFQEVYQAISQIDKVGPFECRSFDISTRKAYTENNFYAPFHSIPLTKYEYKEEKSLGKQVAVKINEPA